MRRALIENGVVVNVAVFADDTPDEAGWIAVPRSVGPGWTRRGNSSVFDSPARVPVPEELPFTTLDDIIEELDIDLPGFKARINARKNSRIKAFGKR